MDILIIGLCGVVFAVVSLLAWYMMFGMREKTFEDALAEQKGLGILLSSGQQAGKSADKRKEKRHVDTGGGVTKTKVQQKVNEIASAVTATVAPKAQKKGGDEKGKVQRQRSTASTAADEKPAKEVKREKEQSPATLGGFESSRSRQSSSGEGIRNYESAESKVKTQHYQHEEPPRQETDEQKASAKKANKKKRRTDTDEVAAISSVSEAKSEPYQEVADQKKSHDVTESGKEDETKNITESMETAAQLKKNQKKKQKPKEEQASVENKENIEGIRQEKVTAVPASSKSTKQTTRAKSANVDEINLDVIIERLKTSPLSPGQLEFIVDAVLNKQEQWNQNTQKVDQLAALKKQLEEKEKALAQESQLTIGVNQKLKELRQQLDAEKNRHVTSDRAHHDQLAVKQRDLQAAQAKVQELTAQCGQLSVQHHQAQEQVRKLYEQANPGQIQQLQQENQRLKEVLARNEQESHGRAAELQRLHQELLQRDNQLHQADQRLVHLQQNVSLQEGAHQQLTELRQKLVAKDAAYSQLEQELTALRGEWNLLEKSVSDLRQNSNILGHQPHVVERNVNLQNSQADNGDLSQIEKFKSEINELKSSKDRLTQDLKVSKTLATDLEKRSDQSQAELRKLKENLDHANSERANIASKMEAENKKLVAELEKIKKLEKSEHDVREKFEKEKKLRESVDAENLKLKSELDSIKKQLEAEKVHSSKESGDTKKFASGNGHGETVSADTLKIQEFSLTHLNKQLISKDGEINTLKQALDQQRQKNSELRERNQKIVEAMNQLEKTSKEVTQKTETKYQKQLEEQEKQVKLTLTKIIPDVKIPQKEHFDEWIKEVQRVASEKPTTLKSAEKNVRVSDMEVKSQPSKELEKLQRQNADLQSDLARYKRAVEETDSFFKSLEAKYLTEERSWQIRVKNLESELEAAKAGHGSGSSGKQSKDIEAKLESLQKSVGAFEADCNSYKSELERAKADLESERVSARDLSSQLVKLRGMLKTGQDALKHEQTLVGQLENQLKAFQANVATTPSTEAKEGKGEQQLQDELKDLRAKLAQREQQLEKEMNINKQLNNKLTSLGVTASSSSNGSL